VTDHHLGGPHPDDRGTAADVLTGGEGTGLNSGINLFATDYAASDVRWGGEAAVRPTRRGQRSREEVDAEAAEATWRIRGDNEEVELRGPREEVARTTR
jgi:hypothetical protein